jgi:hypothetical protein
VIVEPHGALGVVGQVRHDVVGAHVEAALADLLGMDELDRVDLLAAREDERAGQPVEIAARDDAHPVS